MKYKNRGFGGLQFVLVFAIIGAMATFAIPQYKSYVSKAKLTEAFKLAGESKRKLSEFYMLNGRFPQTESESQMMITTTVAPPEFVEEMVVDPNDERGDITIRVYLREGVVENETGEEQFVYIAGHSTPGDGYQITWSCGASGLGDDLLPEDCNG